MSFTEWHLMNNDSKIYNYDFINYGFLNYGFIGDLNWTWPIVLRAIVLTNGIYHGFVAANLPLYY